MSSIIRELFDAQMHWVNVFLKLRRIIGTLKAHFPSCLWPGALPQHPYSSDEMPGPTELVLAVGFRTCNTLGFFFFFFFKPPGSSSLENPKGDSETFRESDQSRGL